MQFKVYQQINIILRGESVAFFILVLPCPTGRSEVTPTYNVPFRWLAVIYTKNCFGIQKRLDSRLRGNDGIGTHLASISQLSPATKYR